MVVKAAGAEFVAVVIYNNVKGPDAVILKRFHEPAFNNPVVRFIDTSGKDILPRVENDWTARTLLKRMVQSLEKVERKVPDYLKEATAAEK